MNSKISRFLVRWLVSVLALWITFELLGNESISFGGEVSVLIISGLILAILNTILKPVVVFLTLPAVLLTMGIFIIVINALMVLIVSWLYGPFEISGFGIAVITGMVIGLVNWLVSALLEDEK
jgi:putative membrane protein